MLGSIWLFYNNLVVMIRLFFVLACEWNGHKNVFYFVFMRNISVARTNTAACLPCGRGLLRVAGQLLRGNGRSLQMGSELSESETETRRGRTPIWNMLFARG